VREAGERGRGNKQTQDLSHEGEHKDSLKKTTALGKSFNRREKGKKRRGGEK